MYVRENNARSWPPRFSYGYVEDLKVIFCLNECLVMEPFLGSNNHLLEILGGQLLSSNKNLGNDFSSGVPYNIILQPIPLS